MHPRQFFLKIPKPALSGWQKFIFVSLIFFRFSVSGQPLQKEVDVSKVISTYTFDSLPVSFVPVKMNVEKEYPHIFQSVKTKVPIIILPDRAIYKIIIKFQLINSGDSATTCYFFPGFHFSNVVLYKTEQNNNLSVLPVLSPLHKDSVAFRGIKIPAKDTMNILAECFQVKTNSNIFRPKIINANYISDIILQFHAANKGEGIFTYLFCGFLTMMVLFSLANFILGKSTGFLYYAGYTLFTGAMLFTKKYYYFRSNLRNFFFEEYLDFILQGIGFCFLMAFMKRFLETRKNYPFLHKLYTLGIWFVIATLIIYSYLHYGTDNFVAEQILENYITKGVLLGMIIIFLFYAVKKWQNKLFRYLFFGNLLFLIFSLASLLLVINPFFFSLPGILRSALVLYEIGLVLELIFFLIGLTYKNRVELIEKVMESERLKSENERKELEKQMAVVAAHQEERERISADMHDELGSGMTTIRLMSEIAKNKMKENVPVEIEKISTSSNDLLNKMNAIIWSMNSGNDTVDNLVSYIRAYAIDYLDGTSIHCIINTPETIPNTEISGDKRRNIFLCIKETLNNSLKHSKTSEMVIDISINHTLVIKIADNGIGIDPGKTSQFGNGLKNISRRMKNIGGTCTFKTNNGFETTLELNL